MSSSKTYLVALVLVMLVACKTRQKVPRATDSTLKGKFQIHRLTISNQTDTFGDSSFYVLFQSNAIQAFIGCNQIRGTYTQQGDKLKVNVSMVTKMYCRNKARHEINLINALEGSTRFSWEEEILKLEGENTHLYLTPLQ